MQTFSLAWILTYLKGSLFSILHCRSYRVCNSLCFTMKYNHRKKYTTLETVGLILLNTRFLWYGMHLYCSCLARAVMTCALKWMQMSCYSVSFICMRCFSINIRVYYSFTLMKTWYLKWGRSSVYSVGFSTAWSSI